MIEIKRVDDKKSLRQFIQFYYDLYRNCQYAVPYLFFDEMDTLNKKKNPAFEICEADYFLAYKDGKVVGRVAAMINHRANQRWNRQLVRFGWLDFIDDREVSAALIQTVEQWGKERGMNEIGGPFGFTDMDREGMLVEGFDRLSTMYINYNYPYYPQHIEQMGGFRKDNDYVEFRVRIPEKTPDKIARLAQMVEQRYHLHVHKFTRDELLNQGMGREVFRILNLTYNDLYGFSQLSEKQIDKLVSDYIEKADLDLVTAIIDSSDHDKMVGFGISFPSFSKALQKTHDGRLFPFGWWHLLKILKFHRTDTVDLLLIGVLPEYRSKGANALIFNDILQRVHKYGYKWAEAMPQMETNKAVLSHWQYFDSEQHRRHRCYCREIK